MNYLFIKSLILVGLLFSINAQATSWVACGCKDHAGEFKRSCHSTSSCETCCGYENENGVQGKELSSDHEVTSKRVDHEGKNVTIIEAGPR